MEREANCYTADMNIRQKPTRFTALAVVAVVLALAAYTVSYFAVGELRTLPLPMELTETRVFESRSAYLFYTPLRRLESAVSQRETAYRE